MDREDEPWTGTRLTATEREFFRNVAQFVFSNPFSEGREQLLAALVPGVPIGTLRRDRLALANVVARKLERFDAGGLAKLGSFAAEDRPLLETAFVYLAYHRFIEDLDRLIERQLKSDAVLSVPFAAEFLKAMGQRGFGEEDSLRYLGFFYQLRRAFDFIVHSLVGDSPSMQRLRLQLWNNAFTHDMRNFNQRLWNRMEDFSTLILGETGTGKGSAAAAIGRSSFIPYSPASGGFAANFTQTFVSLNLSQFPETLIESELFGHRKGAFTGAIDHHEGVFELCSEHGALFLDEIGEVTVPVQIKLLQVLQERSFTPLGSHSAKRFKGRVIGATNRPLEELRAGGRMRDDFFYRLCSDVIEVPPLRERIGEAPGELDQLVALLIERMTGEPSPALADMALEALRRQLPKEYAWPGNVRELEQAVRRILLTGRYDGDRRKQARSQEEILLESMRAGSLTADELVGRYCSMLYQRNPNYSEVASRTGLDRRTVRKHMQRFAPPA